MFIRKKDSLIPYENGSWKPLFHFNFQGQSKKGELYKGYSNLFAFSDDFFGNDFEFPAHEHKIFIVGTYVIDGILEHKDSTDQKATQLKNGDFQFTDTARGILHSETPISDKVHSIQMWFFPNKISDAPSYKTFRAKDYQEDGSFFINQDNLNADIKIGVLKTDGDISLGEKDRKSYIYVVEGELGIDKHKVLKQEVIVLENETIKIKNKKEVKLLILSLE